MEAVFLAKAGLLVLSLSLALYFDLKEGKIKNLITLPAALGGLVLNYLESGSSGLFTALTGWLFPILMLIIFYGINVMGAGDIKLFAAIGAIMGLPFLVYSFVFTVYIGGVMAVVMLISRKEFVRRLKYLLSYLKLVLLMQKPIAYSAKTDLTSKFVFSTAIVPGTLLQLGLTVLK